MSIPKMLTWNDRFALIDKFKPSDNTIIILFGVTTDELTVARNLRYVGTLIPSKNVDYESYASTFLNIKQERPIMAEKQPPLPILPETATKKQAKRGRKGNKISTAFNNVPLTQTNAEAFAAKYNVSIAVLRQSKRFDPYNGNIRVKKNKESGKLMIWREPQKEEV